MGKPLGLQRLELATHGLRPWLFYPFGRRKQGLEGFEPSAYGLGNRGATVHPVRNNAFSVGPDAPQSGPSVQFGHKYAPHKFSEQRSFDVDVFVTVRSAGSQHCA